MMNITNSSVLNSVDPLPVDWLTATRIKFISETISPLASLLLKSDLFDQLVMSWLLDEIFKECSPEIYNSSTRAFNTLDNNEPSYQEVRSQAVLDWAADNWGHRLESLYLAKKSYLDTISCRIITCSDKHLAYEIYLRLLNKEDTFENLSAMFGIGPERFRGGVFSSQSLSSFAPKLRRTLLDLNPGGLLKPFVYGKGFAVLQLDSIQWAEFNESTKNKLLKLELKDWQQAMLESVKSHLLLSH